MLTRFLAFLNNHALLPPGQPSLGQPSLGQPSLLAVSGGMDSVVMADLFHRAGLPMGIAHVNFGLRGAESDGDAAFVRELAERYGVDYHAFTPDTRVYATANGLSIQMAAREIRYDFFEKTARESGYGAVATAHHQDDLAETMLLNLTRGTGLAGLHGIRPRRGNLIRPLLFTNRVEIAQYATEQGLRWRDDSSNATDKYARNRIRHHVLPVLTSLNPDLSASMTATAERLRAAEVLLNEALAESWRAVTTEANGLIIIDKQKLSALPEPAFRLGDWLRPFGFTEIQTQTMARLLPTNHKPSPDRIGQVFQSATHQIRHERTAFVLGVKASDTVPAIILLDEPHMNQPPIRVLMPGFSTVTMTVFDRPADFILPTDPTVVCLDADALTWPLTLRDWQQGDRFGPIGMSGTKLVSDLLNDRKVTASERANARVLVDATGQIGWVIGYRLARDFMISKPTRRVLRLQIGLEPSWAES